MKKGHFLFFIFLLMISVSELSANVRLPKLISDGMVLQCNAKVKIWGWADVGEKISVTIGKETYRTEADAKGNWTVVVKAHRADAKPLSIVITGNNTIEIKNVLFGDVWLCSGQSNMELPMSRVKPLYEKELKTANNPQIRFFTVPQRYNFHSPQTDYQSGSWQETNPQTIGNFSAVAYFFAYRLNADYHIPIGIINASLGGSPIQAWMSEEALKSFPDYLKEAYRWSNDDLIKETESADNKAIGNWYAEANGKDIGEKEHWKLPETDDSSWETLQVPGYWNEKYPDIKNGVIWFRKEITISKEDVGKAAFLNMGRIVDADSVFINGKCVGNITYQYPPRWYNVPENILKEGRNVVAVRLVSNSGNGGFVPDKPYSLTIGSTLIDLKGEWKMKQGCAMPPTPSQTFIRWKPMGLYNGMIAPLNDYAKKGIVWYQGESNVYNPREYEKLLPAMIANWRTKFSQGNLPFLYAQLPNFMEAKAEPSESGWAMLRESQLKTLSVKNTAMSVNIDLGEWNDIHPLGKKPVGERLALLAEKWLYPPHSKTKNLPLVTLVTSTKISGDKIIITFSKNLKIKNNGSLKCIAISGPDKKFVWAKAIIEDNKLTVWNDKISQPIAVRYAWADNPEGANLTDTGGNMISPFRTDDW